MGVLTIHNISIEGVAIIKPNHFEDERGFFLENFKVSSYSNPLIENIKFTIEYCTIPFQMAFLKMQHR